MSEIPREVMDVLNRLEGLKHQATVEHLSVDVLKDVLETAGRGIELMSTEALRIKARLAKCEAALRKICEFNGKLMPGLQMESVLRIANEALAAMGDGDE